MSGYGHIFFIGADVDERRRVAVGRMTGLRAGSYISTWIAGARRADLRAWSSGTSRFQFTSGVALRSGARAKRVRKSMASTPCWPAVRSTVITRPWVAAPRQVRLPPHTLRLTTAGRMACSPRQLVASTPGRVR